MARRHPFAFKAVQISRDVVLFTCGLIGVAHETVVQNGERPALLVLFAAMMGLPLYLQKDKGNGS